MSKSGRYFSLGLILLVTVLVIKIALQDQIAAKPEGPGDSCRQTPEFIKKLPMTNPQLDTTRRDQIGLTLFDADDSSKRTFQKESWKAFGMLGGLARDNTGAVYTTNVPFINTLLSTPETHLAVLKVNPESGELEKWATIEGPDPSPKNYYGITALAFDCPNNLLYVSAISGSEPLNERGFIAVLDTKTGQEKYRYQGIDVLGMAVFGGSGGRYLYVGLARSSDIKRISLSSNGKPFGAAEHVLSFDKFNRTRAHGIEFEDASMQVKTTEFYYNLIANTEFDSKVLTYEYNRQEDRFTDSTGRE